MNTEINFLKKEQNKPVASIILGTVFILLLIFLVIALLFQKNTYDNQLKNLELERNQMEAAMLEIQHDVDADKQRGRTEQVTEAIEKEMKPTVALYHQIVELLPSEERLNGYDDAIENQIIIDASFDTLDDVAEYIASLTEQNYIQAAQLTAAVKVEDSYEATLTVTTDSDNLVEELAANE